MKEFRQFSRLHRSQRCASLSISFLDRKGYWGLVVVTINSKGLGAIYLENAKLWSKGSWFG